MPGASPKAAGPLRNAAASAAAGSVAPSRRHPKWPWIGLAIGAVALIGWKFGGDWLATPRVDQFSQAQVSQRAESFSAALPIVLTYVTGDDLPAAMASLGLDPQSRAAFEADMRKRAPGAQPASAAATPEGKADPARDRLPVAWITLWDTDAVDGDTVRVTSDGYSRDVHLAKQPLTIAVPVPKSGVVNLAGVRDGSGGITVGVLSDGKRVALPLMSEGQVLGIPVIAR